jgi:hypothetical protein
MEAHGGFYMRQNDLLMKMMRAQAQWSRAKHLCPWRFLEEKRPIQTTLYEFVDIPISGETIVWRSNHKFIYYHHLNGTSGVTTISREEHDAAHYIPTTPRSLYISFP